MQVNKFMAMAVGLVVGVMLIAGVVAPVIANVSSDGGGSAKSHTNTGGSDRYSLADENTNFSVYPVAEHVISLQPDTVENRVTYEIVSDYMIWFTELGDRAQYGIREHIGDSGSVMLFGGTFTMLSITGTTLTGYKYDGTTMVLGGSEVLYYMDPLGSYIDNIGYTYNEETDYYDGTMGTAYMFKDTPIYAEIDFYVDDEGDYGDDVASFYIYGSSTNHNIMVDSDLDCGDTAIFTFTGDILSSIGLTIDGVLYTVPIPPQGQSPVSVATANGMVFDLYMFIVPIEVAEESGAESDDGNSGNGISPTLKTTLTVIPLVMTVGLVLGAVAFFRMKN